MFDIYDVVGLEKTKAIDVLKINGYKNIKVVDNFKHNEKCDTFIVCAVKQNKDNVTLVCGEFYLKIEE